MSCSCTHPADLASEVCVGGHVCEGERAAGWEVEETLVESRGEEAHRRTTMNQGECQQTAHVKVQVLTQSYTHRHTFTIHFTCWLSSIILITCYKWKACGYNYLTVARKTSYISA